MDYQTGEFTFFNLKVCETVSIEKAEEIEVFEVKENKIETSTDIDYGTISLRKRGKSIIKIGNMKLGGTDVKIEVSTKFNWLQKKLCKYLLNIEIEDIEEDE